MSAFLRGLILMLVAALLAMVGCGSDATSPPDDGVVRGTVTRIYAGQPIAGATVNVADQQQVTDAQGGFQFPHVVQGSTVLSVTAPGYAPHQRALAVGNWQSVFIALTPVDSLVTVTGRVRHDIDGPLQVVFTLAGREVRSGSDGLWSLDDVPLGPSLLVLEHAPYNRLEAQVTVVEADQFLDVQLTRDVTIELSIEHDSYVCTQVDSLNANRGQRVLLWASPTLGRTAMFNLPVPGPDWAETEVAEATLLLHANLRPEEEDWDGDTEVTMQLNWISESFYENAVDDAQRPTWTAGNLETRNLERGLPDQSVELDVTPALARGPLEPAGVAIAVPEGLLGVGIASSEYGTEGEPEAAWRPRVRYVLRF